MMKKPTKRSSTKARQTCWPRVRTFSPERRSIAATSPGWKITCASTKRVAEGKASFWACSRFRYWVAWAGTAIEAMIAGGAAHFIQSLMIRGRLEMESDAAQHRVRLGAPALAIQHLLVGELQHQLGGREDRDPRG